jgi:TP901 family phage tail tape measure protein
MPGLQLIIELDDKGAIAKVQTLDKSYAKFTGGMEAKAATAASAMNKISSATHAMQSAIQRLSMIGGVSLGVLSGKMFYTGVQFEQSMANVKAASRATTGELRELELMARKYAVGSVFSAREIATAMGALAREGMRVGEIKSVIGQVLLFAGATGFELGQTIETITELMHSFGISADETGALVQKLTGVMSVTAIAPLMDALGAAGPVAAELGMSIEDLIVDFALLHERGIEGVAAGNKFRIMLGQLLSPSKEVQDMLGGVAFTGNNLDQVLNQLRKSGASTSQIMGAFGTRGGGAVLVKLLESTAEEADKVRKAFDDTSAAQTALNDRMEATKAKMALFKNAIDEKLIAAFEAIKPAVITAMAAMKQAFEDEMPGIIAQIQAMGDWIAKHKDLTVTVMENVPKILGLSIALSVLCSVTNTVIGAVKILGPLILWLAGTAMGGLISAVVVGYTGAILYDKALRAIGVGNPLANIIDAFTQMRDRAREAKEAAQQVGEQNIIIPGKGLYTIPPISPTPVPTGPLGEAAMAYATTRWQNRYNPPESAFVGPPVPTPGTSTPPPAPRFAPKPASVPELAAGTMATLMEGPIQMSWAQFVAEGKRAAAGVADYQKATYLQTIASNSVADEAWLQAKIGLAQAERDERIAAEGATATQIMEARIACDEAVKQAELAHNEAVWEAWQQRYQGVVVLMQGLEAGYYALVDSALDAEMSGKKRREVIWFAMKQSFLKITADMLKQWLVQQVRNLVIQNASKVADFAAEKLLVAHMAAAKAYSAYMTIPFVGPALGAAAAAQAFAVTLAFHKGGLVGDERIVKVQTEEFIMQRSAVRDIGRPAMEYMNATGRIPSSGGQIASGRVAPAGTGASIGPFIFQISASDKETAKGIAEFIEEKIVPMLETAILRRKFSLEGEM